MKKIWPRGGARVPAPPPPLDPPMVHTLPKRSSVAWWLWLSVNQLDVPASRVHRFQLLGVKLCQLVSGAWRWRGGAVSGVVDGRGGTCNLPRLHSHSPVYHHTADRAQSLCHYICIWWLKTKYKSGQVYQPTRIKQMRPFMVSHRSRNLEWNLLLGMIEPVVPCLPGIAVVFVSIEIKWLNDAHSDSSSSQATQSLILSHVWFLLITFGPLPHTKLSVRIEHRYEHFIMHIFLNYFKSLWSLFRDGPKTSHSGEVGPPC